MYSRSANSMFDVLKLRGVHVLVLRSEDSVCGVVSKEIRHKPHVNLSVAWLFLLMQFLAFPFAQAQQPLCARVKIEIRQDVTLESQAFEATMTISNALADRSITDVNVDVLFETAAGLPVEKTSDPSN